MPKAKKKSGTMIDAIADYLPEPFKRVVTAKRKNKANLKRTKCKSKGMDYDQSTGKCK